ncbi:MAG: hypothetical protein DBY36_00230 [Clostridiales bacterium]|nr:MAG: hypothetical protein DBY36_00230 [Clostridiales bacterium]
MENSGVFFCFQAGKKLEKAGGGVDFSAAGAYTVYAVLQAQIPPDMKMEFPSIRVKGGRFIS